MQQTIYRDEFQGNYLALLEAYNEMMEERDSLKAEIRAVKKQNFLLCTATREVEILKEEIGNYRASASHANEKLLVVSHKEKTRKGFFAIEYKQLGPYSKIIFDLLPAELERRKDHMDKEGFTHTYIQDMSFLAGCGRNTASKAIDELVECGMVARKFKPRGDGSNKTDVYLKILSITPEQVKNPEPREIGGDRRCPQCGGYCKKKVSVTYACEPCGIEYDKDMNVVDYSSKVTPTPITEPVKEVIAVPEHVTTPEQQELKKPVLLLPRCKDWRCSLKPNKTQRKFNGFYCPNHRGYIDKEGKPI